MRADPFHILTLLFVLMVSACSSSGTLEMARAKTETIPPGKSVALRVMPTVASDASQGSPSGRV